MYIECSKDQMTSQKKNRFVKRNHTILAYQKENGNLTINANIEYQLPNFEISLHQPPVNTSHSTRDMQSACSHIRTCAVGFEYREQFRSAMLLT